MFSVHESINASVEDRRLRRFKLEDGTEVGLLSTYQGRDIEGQSTWGYDNGEPKTRRIVQEIFD